MINSINTRLFFAFAVCSAIAIGMLNFFFINSAGSDIQANKEQSQIISDQKMAIIQWNITYYYMQHGSWGGCSGEYWVARRCV